MKIASDLLLEIFGFSPLGYRCSAWVILEVMPAVELPRLLASIDAIHVSVLLTPAQWYGRHGDGFSALLFLPAWHWVDSYGESRFQEV